MSAAIKRLIFFFARDVRLKLLNGLRASKMIERIWLATTPDELELPIAVADSSTQLAQILGTTSSALIRIKTRMKDGAQPRDYKIFLIELEKTNEVH